MEKNNIVGLDLLIKELRVKYWEANSEILVVPQEIERLLEV